ncbi:Vps51/Vps67 domain-containing protein [Desarmillaria tabescens]|uniref:Conserved oligomeric Golgi complex subunit 1 n=1 Tax=Armillaria tabescens TaxID=1929756 RepID=A0AA39NH95_ARMTA|nr:Vps51/Vps67 domain-containing protein [Desarmillaria tabescens]KAK0465603.1 Vps51/Vps67 domain-containing protein [Desarmillaria tabescens]
MLRRPSIPSASSSSTSVANGHTPNAIPLSMSGGGSSRSSKKLSLSKLPPADELDPDELFTKYTISEVIFVQQQLRADADAKQEELRLMVGERYRDLLQASSSIVSIARSSKRVIEALDETKSAILAQEQPQLPRKASMNGTQDTHLYTLQLLSAHIKLLLDAPEHLWRLIERKKYFTAAWLLLLSRVVHRSLIQHDQQEEDTWTSQGLDALDQFPLIQRQWDAVSQFRSQIVHKATMSLREYNTSSFDTCATLLTLHLLDSRPLTETLSVFLEQRSKSLHTAISWGQSKPSVSPSSNRANGYAPENTVNPKQTVKQIKDAAQVALDTIALTVKTARDVFEDKDSEKSMVAAVMEHIQSDSSLPPAQKALPAELQLTTQALLMTLPSSTHFMLLPQNLKSYKPYVDLDSSSSRVPPSHLIQKVDEWFKKSTHILQGALDRWFLDVSAVKDVWSLRSTVRKWIYSSSGLKEQEMEDINLIFDDVCRRRIAEIWKTSLISTQASFGTSLSTAVLSFGENVDVRIDNSFQTPPLPTASSLGPMDASFQKYKSALRKQLLGRTTLLDDLLRTLENCARSIQHDLSRVLTGDNSNVLVTRLRNDYQLQAAILCSGVVDALNSASESIDDRSNITGLVFVGQLADELATYSSFVTDVSADVSVEKDFREKAKLCRDDIVDRWRSYTISNILSTHRHRALLPVLPSSSVSTVPSPDLMGALLSLTHAMQDLGISRDLRRQGNLVDRTLQTFIEQFLRNRFDANSIQTLYDISFLQKLIDVRTGSDWTDVRQVLDEKAVHIREKVTAHLPTSSCSVAQFTVDSNVTGSRKDQTHCL